MHKSIKYFLAVTFILIFCLFLLIKSIDRQTPQLKVTPMVFGNNYRLLIELPHGYDEIYCNFQGINYKPKLLKIADNATLYEVFFTNLVDFDYSCTLFLKKKDGTKMEMTYYFTIIGGVL